MLPLVRVGDPLRFSSYEASGNCFLGISKLVARGYLYRLGNFEAVLHMFRCVGSALASLVLLGCAAAENEMVGGSLKAINHVEDTAINWFSVNGYRVHGGRGSSCCIVMPIKWRPGLRADIEWEVDADPYAYSKWPPLGSDGYRAEQVKHKAKYRHYSATVDIPAWSGTERCGLSVHFLACNKVKVTSSCWMYGHPNNPIKESSYVKEPVVCAK